MAWFTALEKSVIPLRVIKAFLVKASLLKTVVNIRCEHKIVLFHPLIKPLSNIRKVNLKVAIVNIHRNRLVKSIYNRVDITLKVIYQNPLLREIQYPILAHTCFHILRQLQRKIPLLRRRRNHLHKEIRRTVYAKPLNLIRVAYDTYIRLNHSPVIAV